MATVTLYNTANRTSIIGPYINTYNSLLNKITLLQCPPKYLRGSCGRFRSLPEVVLRSDDGPHREDHPHDAASQNRVG